MNNSCAAGIQLMILCITKECSEFYKATMKIEDDC